MSKFIKLTETHSNGTLTSIYVNMDHVISFSLSSRGDTHLRMHGKDYFFVKESVELVAEMVSSELPYMTPGEREVFFDEKRISEGIKSNGKHK